MRLACFGGSFDPPHLGHVHIAREAANRLTLDQVLFAPVGRQPLKSEQVPPAPFRARVAMLRAMLAEPSLADSRFEVTELDAPLPSGRPNYTFETLLTLREHLAPADELFFLAGADSLLTLPHWHRAADLLPLASWIIAARPQFAMRELIDALCLVMPASSLQQAEPSSAAIEHLVLTSEARPISPVHIYLLPDLSENVSATAIRSELARTREARNFPLAASVYQYIREHGLYRSGEQAGYDRT
jgi:nicotinate-nucleotide adenylyltransferase